MSGGAVLRHLGAVVLWVLVCGAFVAGTATSYSMLLRGWRMFLPEYAAWTVLACAVVGILTVGLAAAADAVLPGVSTARRAMGAGVVAMGVVPALLLMIISPLRFDPFFGYSAAFAAPLGLAAAGLLVGWSVLRRRPWWMLLIAGALAVLTAVLAALAGDAVFTAYVSLGTRAPEPLRLLLSMFHANLVPMVTFLVLGAAHGALALIDVLRGAGAARAAT